MSDASARFAVELTTRSTEIVDEARAMLEELGWEAVSMRPLADRLGIRAPSLYKHFSKRDQIRWALVVQGLIEMGDALHAVLARSGSVSDLLAAYRDTGRRNPNLYRLATSGTLDRARLPDGLEEWSGAPFFVVTGDEFVAQALWSFAHGALILELDGRYPPGSDLDRTWAVAANLITGSSAPANQSRR